MKLTKTALLSLALILAAANFVLSEPIHRYGWPFFLGPDMGAVHRNSLSVATLEDGSPVIAAAAFSYIGVFDINGNPLPGWPLALEDPYYIAAGPVLGDVDGDGQLDIVFATRDLPEYQRVIFKYSLTGVLDEDFTYDFNEGMQYPITSPVLVDLDNDSLHTDEILFTADSLYAVYGNGTPFPGFPWDLGGEATPLSGIVVGTGDEWEQPVVFWSTYGQFHARQIDQEEELPGWPVHIQNTEWLCNPVLIPREDDWNIAIGSGDSLWVFDSGGQVLPGFPFFPYAVAEVRTLIYLTVGDIDGDGNPELVFKLLNENFLEVVDLSGNSLPGFPLDLNWFGRGEPWTIIRDQLDSSALLFGASQPDVIWGDDIYGLRYNHVLPGFPVHEEVPRETAHVALIPPVDDTLHIVYNSVNGLVDCWDLPMEGVGTNIEWQMPGSTPGGNPIYRPQPPLEEQNSVPEQLPSTIELKTIYPNPGNGSFTFSVLPHRTGQVSVRVHNVLGQSVWEESFPVWAGVERSLVWPATDNSGRPVPSGIYLIDVDGNVSGAMKAVLLR